MPTPEELAREKIDPLLNRCGWVVQDKSAVVFSCKVSTFKVRAKNMVSGAGL